MKKIIAIFALLLLFPSVVFASEYTTMNLEETLESEGIDITYSSYEENDDQVTIYLFRGSGCSHCEEFLEFLNSIVDEYGEYFKVVSYEVWYDSTDNAELLDEVAGYFGESSYGVPFIVIGDNHWVGYSSSYDDEIISAILELYGEDEKFDVLDELGVESTTKESESSNTGLIVWNIVLSCIIVYMLISYNSKIKVLNEDIETLNKKVNKISDTKEKKPEAKKKTVKE